MYIHIYILLYTCVHRLVYIHVYIYIHTHTLACTTRFTSQLLEVFSILSDDRIVMRHIGKLKT